MSEKTWHLSTVTGKPEECHATQVPCKYANGEHYSNIEQAWTAHAERNETDFGLFATTNRKSKRNGQDSARSTVVDNSTITGRRVRYRDVHTLRVGDYIREYEPNEESIVVDRPFTLDNYKERSRNFRNKVLNPRQREALNFYVEASSAGINRELWARSPQDRFSEEYGGIITAIDQLTSKAYSNGSDRPLYRRVMALSENVEDFEEEMKQYYPGAKIVWKGFSSTTEHPAAIRPLLSQPPKIRNNNESGDSLTELESLDASWRHNIIFRVNTDYSAPVGTDLYTKEQEHLLPRDTELTITKVTESTFESEYDVDGKSMGRRNLYPVIIIDAVISSEHYWRDNHQSGANLTGVNRSADPYAIDTGDDDDMWIALPGLDERNNRIESYVDNLFGT